MKLLDRTLIILLFSSFLIIGLSSTAQFYWVKNKIEKRVDKKLLREKKLIKEQLKDIDPKDGFSYNTERASVKFSVKTHSISNDSLFYDDLLNEDREKTRYRILQTSVDVSDQDFRVEIRKEVEETETFIQSIFLTFLVTLFSVILVFIILKYFLLKSTWSPFFDTLHKLKNSDFQNDQIEFNSEIKIQEFLDLNNELNILADNVYNEYQSQKTFTENINHELMTPLAIIKGKLELIIQSENLDEQDLKLVSDIFITLDRLTKLNKSLVLLSKIDNHQYDEKVSVNIQDLLDDIFNLFEDQIRAKNLKIRKQYDFQRKIFINDMLAYLLLSNIIKNAIFHNLDSGGYINIILNEDNIEIINSGQKNNLQEQNVFDRFTKDSSSEDSIGLGLSIVQKICELNDITIQYEQENGVHTFKLQYKSI
jgi:signal transduction histidine kinase